MQDKQETQQASTQQNLENLKLAAKLKLLQKRQGGKAVAKDHRIVPVARSAEMQPSLAQQRLLFLHQLDSQASLAYHMSAALRLRGSLHVAALQAALDRIVARHEVLRTTFSVQDGQARLQIADASQGLALHQEDWRTYSSQQQADQLNAYRSADATLAFDLQHGPLIRCSLLRMGEQEYVLLLTKHHIVSDGWSIGILLEEMSSLYASYAASAEQGASLDYDPLPPLSIQYADYAAWQREFLQDKTVQAQSQYWQKTLQAAPTLLELPTDQPRPLRQSYRGATHSFRLGSQLSANLNTFAQAQGVTPFMCLMASWAILMARLSGQSEVVIGTPVAARERPEVAGLIGFFINTLALRVHLPAELSVSALLAQVKASTLDAYSNQDLPFDQVVDAVKPARSLAHSPLFQTMLALDNTPPGSGLQMPGLQLEMLPDHYTAAQFDLVLSLAQAEHGVQAELRYATDLFGLASIERLVKQWQTLLAAMLAQPAQEISRLPLLDAADQQQIVYGFNQAAKPAKPESAASFENGLCIQQMFEAQVQRAPQALAVVCGEQSLTYAQLNAKANQLANYLQSRGARPDGLIGICLERSLDMIVAILAVLKSGAAYLPLDPMYPAERISYMIEDAQPALVITQASLLANMPLAGAQTFCMDSDWHQLAELDSINLLPTSTPENLAYVIYTSGSTGKPKGALLQHSHVQRLFAATADWFDFNDKDCWTVFHSYAFDFSVWEIWGALLFGGKLVVVPYAVARAPEQFYALLVREGVTILNQTPSAFQQLVDVDAQQSGASQLALRKVIFGGEALNHQALLPWFERHGETQPQLINMYGITETTVHVTYLPLKAQTTRPAAIGVPIPDLRCYVLDPHQQPVPIGVVGELHVAGGGVARGYLNRPELTQERFIADPFFAGQRMYKSGDLARYLADGQLEYLGRIDHQVKIRGFRIELGEIEAALAALPEINSAVVLARADASGEKRLVAYLVAQEGQSVPGRDVLRNALLQGLPDYMVPAHFISLPVMPLTSNGKVDRAALPAPEMTRSEDDYVAPRNAAEVTMAQIWAEVLKLDKVGIYDNFFALGGDSMRTIGIVARAREHGLQVSIEAIFQHQQIAALVEAITQQGPSTPAATPAATSAQLDESLIRAEDRARLPADVTDAYRLSRLQLGMVFHNQLSQERGTYHDVFSHHLRIANFDLAIFSRVLDALVQKHPVLRTAFDLENYSEPLQLIRAQARIVPQVIDLRHLDSAEQDAWLDSWLEQEKQSSFDLQQAPLMRVFLHLLSVDRLQYTLSFHHAIVDGWSVASLQTELFETYAALCAEPQRELALTPLAASFKSVIAQEQQALQNQATREFWTQYLAGHDTPSLPVREAESAAASEAMRSKGEVSLQLAPTLFSQLQDLALQVQVPLRTLILTAHLRVLSMISGSQEVMTGLATHTRPQEQDGDQVLGLFLNTLPMRQRLPEGSWVELVQAVFANEQQITPHRHYPYFELMLQNDRVALYDTAFNYIHFHVYDALAGNAAVEVLHSRDFEATNFGLCLTASKQRDQMHLTLAFDEKILGHSQVTRFLRYYQQVLQAMVEAPQAAHHLQDCLPENERLQILQDWNDTQRDYPSHMTIQQVFESHVASQPEAIALVFEEQQISYAELNQRANQLAHYLLAQGVQAEQRVALCCERGVELTVSMLAVLKAGAAYVPLDPHYPLERMRYMLHDSQPFALLCQARFVEKMQLLSQSASLCNIVVLDEVLQAAQIAAQAGDNPRLPNRGGRDLAFVVYTSGSTGKPKGVMVEHRGVVRFAWQNPLTMPATSADCVAQCANPAFDAASLEIWGGLLNGARLHVFSQTVLLDAQAFAAEVVRGGVNIMFMAVGLFNAYLDHMGSAMAQFKYLLVGGDALDPKIMARALQFGCPPLHLANVYGPTECSMISTGYPIAAIDAAAHSVPIGRPIHNTTTYVLDAHLQLLPIGAVGELHIGGPGVARGYQNLPQMSQERFIPDPFASQADAHLYKSGDLVRWLPDGNLEFVGRRDNQIKLRGFRIELGEIESRLNACAGVHSAVVIVREDVVGEKRLVAYVVAEQGVTLLSASLRAELALQLAEFMLPSAFVVLPSLPLTSNGKLDRRALPAPDLQASSGRAYQAPEGEIEIGLAQIWQDVLGLPQIGRADHFFELGGHSLLAVQMVARVQQSMGLALALRDLFAHPCLAALAAKLSAAEASQSTQIAVVNRQQALPLSWAQQRLWFLDQLDHAASVAYHIPAGLRLQGQVNVAALQASLQQIVLRHEVLRTNFVAQENQLGSAPVQIIHADAQRFSLRQLDLRGLSASEQEQRIAALAQAETQSGFDLAKDCLLRALLLQLASEEYILLVTQHHIISDGWSVAVMVQELASLYRAFAEGEADPLPPLRLQYADYAAWQRNWLQGEVLQQQLQFWQQHLQDAPALLELPLDHPRPTLQSHVGAAQEFALSAELSARLRQFSQQQGVTLFMTLLSAWALLLARMAGQSEVVIGTPVANRQRTEVENLIGFFVNTLALRVQLPAELSVQALLEQVKQTTLAAYSHQDVPFEQVVTALNPPRSLAHSPVFQVMLSLNNTPLSHQLELPGVRLQQLPSKSSTAQFDLSLSLEDDGQQIHGDLEYACALFEASSIERILASFSQVLEGMLADTAQAVARLPLQDERARMRVLRDFNATEVAYPRHLLVHQLLEQQAAAQPERLALVHGSQQLSYQELNQRANQLAHVLRQRGVQADQRVAICAERSIEMVLGLLAIMKAGAAYVPLDPNYPAERLAHMLSDSAPSLLLTQTALLSVIQQLPAQATVLCLDDAKLHAELAQQASSNLAAEEIGCTPENLAYVMYTSGSTGLPKGVMIEHAGLVNYVLGAVKLFALTADDVVLQQNTLNFDLSVEEMWPAFAAGACVKLASQLFGLLEAEHSQEIAPSFVHMTSAHWHNMVGEWKQDPALAQRQLASLRLINVTGDAITVQKVRDWESLRPANLRLVNTYGPTETTVSCTAAYVEYQPQVANQSIGRPMCNVQIYILDAHMQPVPIGVAGEIYIAGAGVARGFLNRDDLTAQRFVTDPFAAHSGARMYKSGDLGRWLEDGSIEYMGRNDFQVKIRGFRMELGEIEGKLAQCHGVQEAVVIARADAAGVKRLLAYVVPTDADATTPAQLRSEMAAVLAEYMVPSAFVLLDQLPLTPNGKLDRAALPEPEQTASASNTFVAPEGDIEQQLAQIWCTLLNVSQVGRADHFFALGGHSLLAVQLIARIRQQMGLEIAVRDLFAQPTLAGLGAVLQQAEQARVQAISRAPREQALALSWAQQRLWFLDQLDPSASRAYHIPAALRLRGQLNLAALRATLARVLARHESLRTVFVSVEGEPQQVILPAAPEFALPVQDVQQAFATSQDQAQFLQELAFAEVEQPFDLARGPLLRAQLLQLAADDYLLLLTQHHIVSDGWSVGILVQELSSLYAAFSQAQPDPLPALALQYADYAHWQRTWLQGEELQTQLQFWRQHLQGAPALLELPLDFPRPAQQSYAGACYAFSFTPELSQAVRQFSQTHGVTVFMSMLCAWSLLMARMSGQSDVVTGTAVANRQRTELESMIGFFVNTLALRVQIDEKASLHELLAQVKHNTLQAYANQDVPFEQVVELLNPTRSMAHSPVFQTMLSFDNTPRESELELPGLHWQELEANYTTAQFDLTLEMADVGECISAELVYAVDVFALESVQRMVENLETILHNMVQATAQQSLATLPWMSAAQQHIVLGEFNDTVAHYPQDKLTHHLFEEQVALHPEEIALVFEQSSLSYDSLNRRANQLAHYLLSFGLEPDQRIALCMERSVEMIVALLAIMKAGCAYVPLDPQYPAERLQHMLQDSAPKLLLTHSALSTLLPAAAQSCQLLLLDTPQVQSQVQQQARLNPELPQVLPQHLAYVMYTSGSTGMPKGVMIEHAGLVNYVLGAVKLFEISRMDVVLQQNTLNFDLSVEEMWPAFAAGATLKLASQLFGMQGMSHSSAADLPQVLPTVVHLTSAHWHNLVGEWKQDPALAQQQLAQVRLINVTGDAIAVQKVRDWEALRPADTRLVNTYGPTETTVSCTASYVHYQERVANQSIGRPMCNVQIYILDKDLRPVPIGVAGEIYIAGAGVARGFLNRADLTEQRFLADPFSSKAGARMYKSGDLGRWLANGTIEYMGRNDFQVKIRGFRMELGEIEAKLAQCQGVREAVVIAREDAPGAKRLVAYVIPQQAASEWQNSQSKQAYAAQWRQEMAASLAEYMLPSAFVLIEKLPLTPNGKLDRAALPAPDADAVASQAFDAAIGEVEQGLAQIWQNLLKLPAVGREDNFFALGGHSLLAVQLMARIRQQFGVELALRNLFDKPVLHDFAALLANSKRSTLQPFELLPRPANIPLSWAQQGLWFLAQYDPAASLAYHVPVGLLLEGALEVPILQATLNRIVARHEILRTRFVADEGGVRQVIAAADCGLSIEQHDLRKLSPSAQAETLEAISQQQVCRAFDLMHGPLLRACLVRTGDYAYALYLTQHHIISDGWSMDVLIHELNEIYTAFSHRQADLLPALPLQYADYATWQRAWLQGEVLQQQLQFWQQHLQDAPALLELPLDHPRPHLQSHVGASQDFVLSSELSARLRQFAKQQGVTLFMILLSAWALLMARMAGQSEVVIGTPVANRQRTEFENLIGFFVNTLALRVQLPEELSVQALLAQVKQTTLAAYSHQDVPFEQVVAALNPPRSLAHSPVFQVMFSFNNTPISQELELPNLRLQQLPSVSRSAQFDLNLSLEDDGQQIEGDLEYASALFDATTIARILANFSQVLESILADTSQTVARLPLQAERARLRVLRDFNATEVEYPRHLLVHQLFEQQAAAQPERVALLHGRQQLSYQELNQRANQLAHLLRQRGVQADQRVAICAERSIDMVLGLLAILKAGAAYVPLDPSYPVERLAHMLRDSAPSLLLTQTALLNVTQQLPLQSTVLCLDDAHLHAELAQQASTNLAPQEIGCTARNLAYVMYTSGSTGLPKGVMIEHAGLVNYVLGAVKLFALTADDVVLQQNTLNFDLSVEEMFPAFAAGACVKLASQLFGLLEVADSQEQMPSFVHMTSAHWHNMVGEWKQNPELAQRQLASLRLINVTGDAIAVQKVRDWESLRPAKLRLVNTYGPTETTVSCTAAYVEYQALIANQSIGRPMCNVQIYILDAHMQPVPIGVAGEIYIAGAGVARGFLNREDLTQQRFVTDPFASQSGARMYKSGDLGRWLEDGSIEYMGRNDFQVKIRGFRMELGEIEAKLAQCKGVQEGVVIARADSAGVKRLLAYVVPTNKAATTPARLRNEMAAVLAEYMVPSAFILLDHLPLTPNGKLDRAALPDPAASALLAHGIVAPEGELENTLAGVWQDLLGLPQIGRDDNFFELGGHSLLAVQLLNRLSKQHGIKIGLRNLYAQPSLAGFAEEVAQLQSGAKQHSNLVPIRPQGSRKPLFFIHPGGGEVSYAQRLAPLMPADLPIYGLAARGLLQGETPLRSIPEMASLYLGYVRKVQAVGPYRLAGWSAGGVLAYEMARQLLAQNQQVEFVGLLDTENPNFQPVAPFPEFVLEQMLVQYFKDEASATVYQRLCELAQQQDSAAMFALVRGEGLIPVEFDNAMAERMLRVSYALEHAAFSYQVEPLAAHVTLFQAQDEPVLPGIGAVLGWAEMVDSACTILTSGNHLSMVEQPHLADLAEALCQQINSLDALQEPRELTT